MTQFNDLSATNAKPADNIAAIVRILETEVWRVTVGNGLLMSEVTLVEHVATEFGGNDSRGIAIQITGLMRGSLWVDGARTTLPNRLLLKKARWWRTRHIAARTQGDPKQ